MNKKDYKNLKNLFYRNKILILTFFIVAISSLGTYMYIQNNNLGMGIMESEHRNALISQAEEVLNESLSGYVGQINLGAGNDLVLYSIEKNNDIIRLQGKCVTKCKLQKIGRKVDGDRKVVYSIVDEDYFDITGTGGTITYPQDKK